MPDGDQGHKLTSAAVHLPPPISIHSKPASCPGELPTAKLVLETLAHVTPGQAKTDQH